MSRRTGSRRGGGVIRPHERDTDDVTPAVTGNLLPSKHEQAIFNTEDKAMSSPVRLEHRNRIRRMILWLDEYYPDIAEQSVHVVTAEEKATPTRYYQNDDDRDFIYNRLDAKYIKAFVAA